MAKIGNPFAQMLVARQPEQFFGRRADLEPILQGVSGREPRSFSIQGVKTIGKTSLLNYVCNPLGALANYAYVLGEYGSRGSGMELEFCFFDFYTVSGEGVLATLYAGLLQSEKLRQYASGMPAAEQLAREKKAEIRKALLGLCRELKEKRLRVVICLDNFDKAFQSLEYEDDIFLRSLTYDQAFILATEKSLAELRQDPRRTSPLVNILFQRNIGLLSEQEARQLLTVPTEGTQAAFTPNEVDFLLRVAGRQPYLLTIGAEFLYNLHLQYPNLQEIIPKGSPAWEQVKSQMGALPAVTEICTLFWNYLSAEERQALSFMARSGERNPEATRPALGSLRQKALVDVDLQTGRFTLFSELFKEFVLQKEQPVRRQGIQEIIEDLSSLDRRLMEYLLAHPNQVCTFEDLLSAVWDDPQASKRALEAAVHRIRTRIQDIEGAGWEYIKNVRRKGYMYTPRPSSD